MFLHLQVILKIDNLPPPLKRKNSIDIKTHCCICMQMSGRSRDFNERQIQYWDGERERGISFMLLSTYNPRPLIFY